MKNLIFLLLALPLVVKGQTEKIDSIPYKYSLIEYKDNVSEVNFIIYQKTEVLKYLSKYEKATEDHIKKILINKIKEIDPFINFKNIENKNSEDLTNWIKDIDRFYDLKIKLEMNLVLLWLNQKELHFKQKLIIAHFAKYGDKLLEVNFKTLSPEEQKKIDEDANDIFYSCSKVFDEVDEGLLMEYTGMSYTDFVMLSTKEKFNVMMNIYKLDGL